MNSALFKGPFGSIVLALLMFGASLGVTYHLWRGAQQDALQRLQIDFYLTARETVTDLSERMATYEQVLRGVQGLMGSSSQISTERFRAYVNALRLQTYFPGIQGIAIAELVPSSKRKQHAAAMRAEGFADYAIFPHGERAVYSSITRIEPFTGLNPRALGYDMLTDPTRRLAMEQARETGEAAASGKVTLIQEAGQRSQNGFVMYVPVYRRGVPLDTPAQRREALQAWIGAPFRMNDLMAGIKNLRVAGLRMQIYDGNAPLPDATLYDSGSPPPAADSAATGWRPAAPGTLQETQHIRVGGHPWTVSVSSLPAFNTRIRSEKPELVAVAGIGASLLLAIIVWGLASGRARALALARQMTRELSASEFRWKYALEGAGDGVFDYDHRAGQIRYSKRWKEMLGYAEQELDDTPDTWSQLVHPDDLAQALVIADAYVGGLAAHYTNEFRMQCKDGTWRWILARGMPVSRDGDGKPVRTIGTHSDITERKLAENKIRLMRDELEVRVHQRTAELRRSNEQLVSEVRQREIMQAELAASQKRLTTIFGTVTEGVVMFARDGTVIESNAAACRMLGLTMAQMTDGTPIGPRLDAVYEDGRPCPLDEQPQALALVTGQPVSDVALGIHHAGGETVWVQMNAVPLRARDGDGPAIAVVVSFSDITRKKQAEETIWKQASFDTVTGLPNRRLFLDHLKHGIEKSTRSGEPFAVLFLDLDRFKDVNDSLGHDMGDVLLEQAAKRIQDCVDSDETVARLGGDEFTVILRAGRSTEEIKAISEKILRALAQPFMLDVDTAYISGSIGITLFPHDATALDDLLVNADRAMYDAKNRGRNRYSFFTAAMQEAAEARVWLANELHSAMGDQQFYLCYQPIVDLRTGEVSKAEALLRWLHPVRGLISPAEFIPVAEETGIIIELGEWLFRQVADQARRWRQTLHPDFQISVNRSAVQFHNAGGNYNAWFDYLREIGLPGQSIAVEITEGLLLDARPEVIEQLLTFRDAGIQVSLDDFGTGYSSLAYLKKFDIDTIKIDQSFVRNLVPGSDDMALCEAIIVMAHTLDIKVVAEGIETEQQRDLLAGLGCDYGQGYLFSMPLEAERFAA